MILSIKLHLPHFEMSTVNCSAARIVATHRWATRLLTKAQTIATGMAFIRFKCLVGRSLTDGLHVVGSISLLG